MAEFKSDPQHPETGRTTQPTGGDNYTFRCSDVGFKPATGPPRLQSGSVLRNAEQHGREQHNLTSIDDETRDKVRSRYAGQPENRSLQDGRTLCVRLFFTR